MKRKTFLAAIISISASVSATCCPIEAVKISGHCALNLAAIFANAKEYFGEKIETQGYLSISNDGYHLVFTDDELNYFNSYNGLLLKNEKNIILEGFIGKRIKVRGGLVSEVNMSIGPSAYYFNVTRVLPVIKSIRKGDSRISHF